MKTKRIEKVNSLIQRLFGEILLEDADMPVDVLVTISAVETTPNLRSATVWLYILPFDSAQGKPGRVEEVFEHIKNQMYDLQGSLNRALSMRPLPRIILKLDHGAEYAERINQRLDSLESGVSDDSRETAGS